MIPERRLSLRDWFAGCALQGLLAHGMPGVPSKEVAESAYRYADRMLEKRDSLPAPDQSGGEP